MIERARIQERYRWIAKGGLIALVVWNIALIAWYVCVQYRYYMHSDSAVKSLLASEIFTTGHYFPHDWNYVNGDIPVLFGHTYIVPLLHFFPNSFSLHAASGIVSAALILLGAWLVAGMLSPSPWIRLCCVAVLSAGMSGVMADNLYGQVSYGTVYYFTCFLIYFAWRFLRHEGKRRRYWAAGLAVTAALMFWANPQRAVISYALPLCAAALVYAAVEWQQGAGRSIQARRGFALLTVFATGAIIGFGMHLWTLKGVNNVQGVGAARWLTFAGMEKNVEITIQGLLALLGGLPTASRPVVSVVGAYEGMRLVASLATLAILPWALCHALRVRDRGVLFVASFALVLTFLHLFLQVATSIPEVSDPVQSSRYLVPALLLLLLILTATVATEAKRSPLPMIGAMALLALATSGYPALVKSSPDNVSRLGTGQGPDDLRVRLAEFLRSSGLRYGYSTYWNAGVLSVLSGEAVRVRQIKYSDGLPIPFRHLSSNRWYLPATWEGETFLLLNPAEQTALDVARMERYNGHPVRTLEFEGMKVLVYPRNLAASMPNWQTP